MPMVYSPSAHPRVRYGFVMPRVPELGGLLPAPESIRLLDSAGEPCTSIVETGPPLEVFFGGLDGDSYTIVVDDPLFERWTRPPAQGGPAGVTR